MAGEKRCGFEERTCFQEEWLVRLDFMNKRVRQKCKIRRYIHATIQWHVRCRGLKGYPTIPCILLNATSTIVAKVHDGWIFDILLICRIRGSVFFSTIMERKMPDSTHIVTSYTRLHICNTFFIVKTVFYQISTSYKNPMGVENNLNYQYDVFVSHLSSFLFFVKHLNMDRFSSWYLKIPALFVRLGLCRVRFQSADRNPWQNFWWSVELCSRLDFLY